MCLFAAIFAQYHNCRADLCGSCGFVDIRVALLLRLLQPPWQPSSLGLPMVDILASRLAFLSFFATGFAMSNR